MITIGSDFGPYALSDCYSLRTGSSEDAVILFEKLARQLFALQ